MKFSLNRGGNRQTLNAILTILVVVVANITRVLTTDLSSASAPLISADPTWWTEYNVTTNTVFKFKHDSSSCNMYIRCLAKYPIEWVYEYTKDHAPLYEENSLQWISTSRSYSSLDFRNANLFTYKSVIRFSCHHNFAEKKILNCRSVSEPSKKTVIEAQYVTSEVARSFTILDRDTPTTYATFKYLLLRLITNEEPAGAEDLPAADSKGNANCIANFYVREVNGGRDPPEWKCVNDNGTTGAIEFRYCRTGMACANLFRTGQQSMVINNTEIKGYWDNSCALKIEKIKNQSCEGCISARSFEPGMVYCSIKGELIGAQQFFYSFRKAETQVNSSGAELLTNLNYSLPLFNLVFTWDEVAPEDMIFSVPFNQTLYAGESVNVTCYFSELFFVAQRVSVVDRDGSVRFLDSYSTYDQKSNAGRVLVQASTSASLSTPGFELAQCWGAVWNTTEWVYVNTTNTNGITLSVPVKPHFGNGTEYFQLYAGDPIRLSCHDPAAVPAPTYIWSYNYTTTLPGYSGLSSYYSGLRNFHNDSYNFDSSRVGHMGIYRCTATNPGGSSIKTFIVSVQSEPMPNFLNTGGARILYEGEAQVSLNCTAKGRPPLTYSWTRSDIRGDHGLAGNSSVLQFNPAKKSDSGSYYCAVSNKDGEKRIQFEVTVREPVPPKFVLSEETFYIYPASPYSSDKSVSTSQVCKVATGDPTPTVQFKTSAYENVPVVMLMGRMQPGDYVCTASNKFGNASKTVNVLAKDGVPPLFDSDLEVVSLEWGSTNKHLTCNVLQGNPSPSISWTKKSEPPVTRGNSTWEFDFVTNTDEGKYVCEASNWAGTVGKLFVVTVSRKSDFSTEATDGGASNNGLWITLFIILLLVIGSATLMMHWKLKIIATLLQSKSEEHGFQGGHAQIEGTLNGVPNSSSMIELYPRNGRLNS